MNSFHPFEIVVRSREAQLEVSKNYNYIVLALEGLKHMC